MDTELNDRLQKVATAELKGRQAVEAEAVASVHQELRPYYDQARKDLAEIEQETPGILREVNQYQHSTRQANINHHQFTNYVNEIVALLQGGKLNGFPAHSAVQDIQAGITAYERLSFQQIQDGHARAIFVVTTRGLLRRGDGMLSRVRAVLGQMKTDLDTWAKSRERA